MFKLRRSASPLDVGWPLVLVVAAVIAQWALIYVYFQCYPTTFAPGTDHHAVLNTTIVGAYQLMAYAALAIFRGKVSSLTLLLLPGLSLAVYESNLFSYLVYGIENLRHGEVSFKYAQDRLVDKQNIITGFLAMLVLVGGVMSLLHKTNVARKIGLAMACALMMALIVYHVNLYFFQFEPLIEEKTEWQNTELRQLSFSNDLKADCAKYAGAECYRFKDGEAWPEGARIQGSQAMQDLEEDYANDWKDLIAKKERLSKDERMIWTEVLREASFDETFAPQYDALIVFTKYYDQNTVIIHRKLITYIFQMSERMSLCILALCLFWLTVGHLVSSSHPRGEDPIPVRRYLSIWLATGLVAFFFEFQIYLHVMLVGLAGALVYRRLWKLLAIGVVVYCMTYSHVGFSIVFMDGFVEQDVLIATACVSGALFFGALMYLTRMAHPYSQRPACIVFGVLTASGMIKLAAMPEVAETGNIDLPAGVFLVSFFFLLSARKEPRLVFAGMFCLMAAIMMAMMTQWFVPGMLADAMREGRAQDPSSQVNMPLATSYFVYGYFSIVMGVVFGYLEKVHRPLFERMREKNNKKTGD